VLIEVAERMYAERGIDGVSLRELGAAAGQLNTGAARYHFGSKVGLVNAVFELRMAPINEHRMRMVDELVDAGAAADVRRLVEAFVVPLSTALGDRDRPTWYLRFAVQAGSLEGSAPRDTSGQPWTSGIDRLTTMVLAATSDVPDIVRAARWEMCQSHIARSLAERERQLDQPTPDRWLSREVFLATVIDTAVAILAAPVSAATTRLLHDTSQRTTR
jgi:AcrR family transcriptional regulator